MKKEVARRGRSTNVRNVGTFKDFILSSKHSEGTEGYEREFDHEAVLLRPFHTAQKSRSLLAQHGCFRHRGRIAEAFCPALNDPGSDLEN